MAQGSPPSQQDMEVDLRRQLNDVFGKFDDFAGLIGTTKQLFGVVPTSGVMRGVTPYSANRLPSNATLPSASLCLQEMRNVPPLIPPLEVNRNETENGGCASEASSSNSHLNDDENDNGRNKRKRNCNHGNDDIPIKRREKREDNKMMRDLFDDDNDDEKEDGRGTINTLPRQGIKDMVQNMQVEPLIPPIDAERILKKTEEEEERERRKKKENEELAKRRKEKSEEEDRKRKKDEEDDRRRKKDDEELRRKEEKRKRKEDEEKKRKGEDEEREREKKRKWKEESQREEEERRIRKEKRRIEKEEKRMKEEEEREMQKKEEENEKKRIVEEEMKREKESREREELAMKIEEEKTREAERIRKEEEEKKKEAELIKKEEEMRKKEMEDKRKREDDERKKKGEEDRMRKEKKKEEDKRRQKEEEKEKRRKEDQERGRKEKEKKGSLSLDTLPYPKLEALKEKERERRKKEKSGLNESRDEKSTSLSIWNEKKKKEEKGKDKKGKESERISRKEGSSARSSPISSKNSSRVATPIPSLSQASTSTHHHGVVGSPSSDIRYSFPLCPSSCCQAEAMVPLSPPVLEQRSDIEGYTSYAKEKKHRGDAANDRVFRFCHYMESCMYFALSVSSYHPSNSSDRELNMAGCVLKDTVDLIKHAMVLFEKEGMSHMTSRIKLLCTRTQAILNYHMYFFRSNKFPRRAETLASLESQIQEIPRESPKKDENGKKSGERALSSSSTSINSNSSNMVTMPMSLWKMKSSQVSTYNYLEFAHLFWNESVKLVGSNEKHYWNAIDNIIIKSFDWGCPLHVGSSLTHLAHFINISVSWIRLEYEAEKIR